MLNTLKAKWESKAVNNPDHTYYKYISFFN